MNEVVLNYGSRWRRLGAFLIDMLVYYVPYFIVGSFIVLTGTTLIDAAFTITLFFYYVLFNCSKYQGTIGKILLGIKVVDLSGSRLSFGRSLWREIVQWITIVPYLWVLPIIGRMNDKSSVEYQVLYSDDQRLIDEYMASNPEFMADILIMTASMILVAVLMFIMYLPILFTREKKGIHDMIARTRVVKK